MIEFIDRYLILIILCLFAFLYAGFLVGMGIHISRNKELDPSERKTLLLRLGQGRMVRIVTYMRHQRQPKNTQGTGVE